MTKTLIEIFPNFTSLGYMQARLDSYGITGTEFIDNIIEGKYGEIVPIEILHRKDREANIRFLHELGQAYLIK